MFNIKPNVNILIHNLTVFCRMFLNIFCLNPFNYTLHGKSYFVRQSMTINNLNQAINGIFPGNCFYKFNQTI